VECLLKLNLNYDESIVGITLIMCLYSLMHRIKKNVYLFLVALLIVISQPGCIALEMLMKAPSEESQDFLKVDISTLKNKDSCKKIGLKLLNSGNNSKAIEAFQKALEFDPNDPEANNYLGRLYFLSFDDKKAKMFFQIAISLKKDYADAYYNLGDLFFREGNLDRAMLNFKTAIQINESYRTKVRQFFGEGFIPLD
jgi:tetratricopeptide (TPR) repeat protein